jgi:hypothetical protein
MLTGKCLCGDVRWAFDATPESATACSCNACRRYGVLWMYGHEGKDVHITGDTTSFVRSDAELVGPAELSFRFCARCGCVAYYRALTPDENGLYGVAVNARMAEPESVADIPIRHFDGHKAWKTLPDDGKRVRDMWF